jgi:hypothetical protein
MFVRMREGWERERKGRMDAHCEFRPKIHIIFSCSIRAYARCRRVCNGEWTPRKKGSGDSRGHRCGGGVVALGTIACYYDGAFESYYEEEYLVEEAVDSRVSLFERAQDCSFGWFSFWCHSEKCFAIALLGMFRRT